MTFAFYGKAETSECTFKTFDLLLHIPKYNCLNCIKPYRRQLCSLMMQEDRAVP